MGAWGSTAWDNDDAADWFGELFETTNLARHVEKALNERDLEEYAGKVRAAAYLLVALGRVYIWPVPDLERQLKLAIAKLEAIRELPDYQGWLEVDEEIAVLRSRLGGSDGRDAPGLPARSGTANQPAEALRNLSDPDPAVRLKAAKWLTKTAALSETSNQVEAWIANAEAMTPIIAALDDPDPKVAEEAVIVVAEASRKYFKDDRAYAGVVRLLKSKRLLTRFWALEAAYWLRGKRCLEDVLPLVEDKANKVKNQALDVIAGAASGKLNSRLRDRLLQAALPILKDKDSVIRGSAANVLGEIGDRSHLDELQKALKKERNNLTKECMERAIEQIDNKG